MPYTFLDLSKRSLRLIKALNVGDEPTAADEQTCLEAGNGLCDSWALENLMIYAASRQVFALAAGKGTYAIGPHAADWVAPRPTYIDGAGMLYAAGAQTAENPIHILTPREWREERIKNLVSNGNIVTKLFYDYAFSGPDSALATLGSGNINVLPIPSAAGSIALYTPQAISELTSINQPIALPPGYKRALAYNLALELWPEFNEGEPDGLIVSIARESKSNIERANFHLDKLKCDPSITHLNGGMFNVFIGE